MNKETIDLINMLQSLSDYISEYQREIYTVLHSNPAQQLFQLHVSIYDFLDVFENHHNIK